MHCCNWHIKNNSFQITPGEISTPTSGSTKTMERNQIQEPAFGAASGSGVTISDDSVSAALSGRKRLLELYIDYGAAKMFHFNVPDTESIKVVKTLLQDRTGVPPNQQELRGWKSCHRYDKSNALFQYPDSMLLSKMNLPIENFLVLLTPDIPSQPKALSGRKRLLKFDIEYRDRNIQFKVPDTHSIKVVKTRLQNELGVPLYQQELRGWKSKEASRLLSVMKIDEMGYPIENLLVLLTPDIPSQLQNGDIEQTCPEDLMFQLTILDKWHNEMYNLNFPPWYTVLQVKTDVQALTDIPVYRQRWKGWTANTVDGPWMDHMTLDESEIPRDHILSVSFHIGA